MIAPHADFISFGTHDLTQTTLGFSRQDAGRFIPFYQEKGIFTDDPFVTIDRKGVGRLMKACVEESRKAKPGIKIGICGRLASDLATVEFCQELGVNFLSCSAYQVPEARLAAAQAKIKGDQFK